MPPNADPMIKQLNIANLQQLDRGKIAVALNHHIRQAVEDVQARAGEKAKRTVTLTIDFTPILDKEHGVLDTVGVAFRVKAAVPQQKSVIYPMVPTNDNTLLFQPGSPADPRQQVLQFQAGERGEVIDKTTGEVTQG